MNRTLLLILCDFLLLMILAHSRWDEPEAQLVESEVGVNGAGAATVEEDMVSLMRLTLEEEAGRRDELTRNLEQTRSTLEEREVNIGRLEQERTSLEEERTALSGSLEETRRREAALGEQLTQVNAAVESERERAARLQRELAEREAEARRRAEEVAKLEREQTEARSRIEDLSVAVRVAEQERTLLQETATVLRGQVEEERRERQRVQESAAQLAQGVGQLAEQSADLSREIRENRPINANILFSEFLANRVQVNFQARRTGFLGTITRDREARTVLVTDGAATYALMHWEDTPLSLADTSQADWERFTADYVTGGGRREIAQMVFLRPDPRLVALPVTEAQQAELGVKVYQTALDPYRFSEAVLISRGGAGYGEVPFRLDPINPGYVRMDNRLMRRLFGDFSPSRGDLVLSKTGELLGIMVNSDFCLVVTAFAEGDRLGLGADLGGRPTAPVLDAQVGRVRRLPGRLQ